MDLRIYYLSVGFECVAAAPPPPPRFFSSPFAGAKDPALAHCCICIALRYPTIPYTPPTNNSVLNLLGSIESDNYWTMLFAASRLASSLGEYIIIL